MVSLVTSVRGCAGTSSSKHSQEEAFGTPPVTIEDAVEEAVGSSSIYKSMDFVYEADTSIPHLPCRQEHCTTGMLSPL